MVLAAGYRGAIDFRLAGVPDDAATTARAGVANALADPHNEAVVRAAQEAFVTGWQLSMWTGTATMAVLLAYLLVRRPGR
ncbi:hypothetical protein [Actinocorallia sp. A-T 12471]|uniref:hypothetical protein n=1 Tax=Actinocorallia sp. A-T 12471 TaxID=3089813 RepID=UPI0029CF0370|nr:hypothetical protein [Actinocorallia sp. A-T 12471]MDX6741672.1 hypothetical protein [Actinocorallia sp. A-T 12471]